MRFPQTRHKRSHSASQSLASYSFLLNCRKTPPSISGYQLNELYTEIKNALIELNKFKYKATYFSAWAPFSYGCAGI